MATRARPVMDGDSAFFWQGVEKEELRIQRCRGCGRLRHPPRPMCGSCASLDWDHRVASGRGTLHSFVVHHHPPVFGFETPFVIALVHREEGTRIVGNLVEIDPSETRIGLPVEACFVRVAEQWRLPQWRPRAGGAR